MIFTETKLKGAFIIDIKRIEDDRGFFARAWCQNEFKAYSLNTNMVQMNVAFSHKRGTIRGMHYQKSPWQEAKLVRCTNGAIYDLIIDLRRDSPTHKQWIGVELTEENRRMLYAPEGFAHGYQTLEDNTEMYYQTTQFYAPEFARGVRFDDPVFGIVWPIEIAVISQQDREWPDYSNQNRL
jgi:dTDP-4-dehydrorhamnose 3,5-epimerase